MSTQMGVNHPPEELGLGMCARIVVLRLTGVHWPDKLADSVNPRSVGDLALGSKVDGIQGMTFILHMCVYIHMCTHIAQPCE